MKARMLADILRRPLVKEAAVKAVDKYLEHVTEKVRDLVESEPNAVHEYGSVAVPINFVSKAKKEIEHSGFLDSCFKGLEFYIEEPCYEGLGEVEEKVYPYSGINEPGISIDYDNLTDDVEFFNLVIEELLERGFDVKVDAHESDVKKIDRKILPLIIVPDDLSDDDTCVADENGKITAKTIADIFFEPQRIERIKESAKTAAEQYYAEALKKFEELAAEEPSVAHFAVAVGLAITDFKNCHIESGDLLTIRDCDMQEVYDGTMAEEELKRFVYSDSEMFTDEVINILSHDMGFELIATSEHGLVPLVYLREIES
ncbi:MAG: hypothetical protein IKE01_01795 [Clostridia bacterium]|nr:hypothetical protein [Clostridia bacterium]